MSNGLIMRVVIKSKQKMKNSIECLKSLFKNDANEKRGLMASKTGTNVLQKIETVS